MKARPQSNTRKRIKAAGVAFLALAIGILFLILSQTVKPEKMDPDRAATTQTVDPDDPGQQIPVPGRSEPIDPHPQPAAETMSGMLLLFSMAGFVVTVIALGWVFYDIRRSRPKWKTQTKFPKRR